MAYNAWGQRNYAWPANPPAEVKSFGYNARWGYRTDDATGLVYCKNRYYDPANGRWLTRDPISYSGGINLYGYCGSGPVANADPRGLYSSTTTPGGAAVLADIAADLGWESAAGAAEVAAEAAEGAELIDLIPYMLPNPRQKSKPGPVTCSPEERKPKRRIPIWPFDPSVVDNAYGPGTRVPDGDKYPGRGKVKWKMPGGEITYEQHPYDKERKGRYVPGHHGPHWHWKFPPSIDHGPGAIPGEPMPADWPWPIPANWPRIDVP